MIPQAIRMAESAFRKYRTRDPFEIMDARNIKFKLFENPEDLLGFYTVLCRKQIIGININASEIEQMTGAIHEVGHSLNDYQRAASGECFNDVKFFSLSNAPSELNANLVGAHLFIPDDYILDQIYYEQYQKVLAYITQHIDQYKTGSAKLAFEETQLHDFYLSHSEIPSYEQFARDLGVDENVVKFKLKALRYKGYDLPNLPETQSDFLKNWKRSR